LKRETLLRVDPEVHGFGLLAHIWRSLNPNQPNQGVWLESCQLLAHAWRLVRMPSASSPDLSGNLLPGSTALPSSLAIDDRLSHV